MYTLTHPSITAPSARLSFLALIFLRCIFFMVFIFTFNHVINFGTSPWLLSLGAVSGIIATSYLAFTRLHHVGLLLLTTLIYIGYRLCFVLLEFVLGKAAPGSFSLYALELHFNLTFLICLIAGLCTWGFWKFKHMLTIEMLFISSMAVYVLAGHRNYRFDSPQILNSLAWSFGIDHLTMIVLTGSGIALSLLTYVYVATLPGKPIADIHRITPVAHRGRPSIGAGILLGTLLGIIFYLIGAEIYQYYNAQALTRTANGVGQERSEGISPLGFHSALGSTNQPAAIVRLEGDYTENPFSPMLYFRESALSDFNGHELVTSERRFDKDVSRTDPEEAYAGDQDADLPGRKPLIQSAYLLTEHKLAFAVDYPISLVTLKNPNIKRFRAAFRAYSVAPTFKLDELVGGGAVGDPRWTEEERNHYLKPHPDQRYTELAQQITAGMTNPVEKAFAVNKFLSKNATYTLTPNHDVKPDDDPVAPFLFGDMRGYCVHFAHATVYMLRALGIPARIGTGYLTDLSQSKDGHILLRMSDRHAWAEAYITGKGWIPFDTQPEKVESHADTQVDMKLLEELMGMLEPGEEILPKEVLKGEQNVELPPEFYIPSIRDLLIGVLTVLLVLIVLKAYLRYGWILPGSSSFRLRRSYVALISLLYDLGYRRNTGETRREFGLRIGNELGLNLTKMAEILNVRVYAQGGEEQFSVADIDNARRADFEAVKSIAKWRRMLAAANPSSIFSATFGARW